MTGHDWERRVYARVYVDPSGHGEVELELRRCARCGATVGLPPCSMFPSRFAAGRANVAGEALMTPDCDEALAAAVLRP